MRAQVHRISTTGPDDIEGLKAAIAAGTINPRHIVAILGKTEGNGCVNDFTRLLSTQSLKAALAEILGSTLQEVQQRIAFVMSGGTEGGLCPHLLVFEADRSPSRDAVPVPGRRGLAIGVSFTREFLPEEIGRMAQIEATAAAVRQAMEEARLQRPEDVHFVQIKCPLLTGPRIAEARARRQSVAAPDTYESMGFSRGASALGVALALGEITADAVCDAVVCRDYSLFSRRASTSAGIELMRNEILVMGNSDAWDGPYTIGHDVMADALDIDAVGRALARIEDAAAVKLNGHTRDMIAAVLCKAEASRSGTIRGHRHVMLDDSDIHASRHARALVGGVLAGQLGDTRLFVSGGAEHQGPSGGGPLALILRH